MRRIVIVSMWTTLLALAAIGCGEDQIFGAVDFNEQSSEALSASPIPDDVTYLEDALACPYELEADTDIEQATDTADFSSAVRPPFDRLIEANRERIDVELEVHPHGDFLILEVSFYNPYRCHWTGHLFLEREDAWGNVRTIGRRYRQMIPGGTRIGGRIIVRRPPNNETHTFVARAYRPNGQDQKTYVNCLLSATDAELTNCEALEPVDEPIVASDDVVEEAWEEVAATSADVVNLRDCLEMNWPPIDVDLRLRGHGRDLEIMAAWRNASRRVWRGDWYVDYTGPFNGVRIERRDLGRRMLPGMGICTYDRVWLHRLGVYRFTARAMRRDGSALARYMEPGTTEIDAVCNEELCEFIEPDQRRAEIYLKGHSLIHLESDFFSEFTRVTMAVGVDATDAVDATGSAELRVIDITELCEIRQHWWGGKNQIEVHFDTGRLPVGPDTWAYYTVELHPMPVVPEGSKLRDSLWILTHGGLCLTDDSAELAACD